jgi:acyl carrier protein
LIECWRYGTISPLDQIKQQMTSATVSADAIRSAIVASVIRITDIAPEDIHDSSTFRDDLGLDSLSVLELTVDLEHAFKIKVPEDRLKSILTVRDTIAFVQESLASA